MREKMSLKERIEGNELDLCLNQLEEVPVKELVACSKATHLDLSCNYLKTLPGNFATLTHLVKIDLSKNSLTELPANFGNLINLQILDLYQNQLKSLPVSFCQLRNLKWLDLKNNPLDSKVKAIAGDCLDEKQCQLCAKKIVAYMQSIDSDLEREKQKKLKEVREKEAIQREKVNKELEEQRRIKKMEKERRKAESKAKREEKLDQEKSQNIFNERISTQAKIVSNETIKTTSSTGWFTMLLYFLLGCLTVYFYFLLQDPHFKRSTLPKIQSISVEYLGKIHDVVSKFLIEAIPFVNNLKSSFLRIVHSAMLSVSKLASNLELFLSIYF